MRPIHRTGSEGVRNLARVVGMAAASVPLLVSLAAGHALAPSLLAIRETSPGEAEVEWKTPVVGIPGAEVRPVLPAECVMVGEAGIERLETAYLARWRIRCPSDGLVGREIGASGIADSRADVVLRVSLADGRSFHALLGPEDPSFRVPERQSRLSIAGDYLRLGIEHIATGFDHLLFVLGLLLLIRGGRRLLGTLTAFTLGHSVTLSLAVLDVVRVPQSVAELGIALSLFLLAVDLAKGETDPPTRMRRFPWTMAALFGLLHGLGFAGALAEIGLPAGDIPLALFSFNAGIEAGQILFVALTLAARLALARTTLRWPAPVTGVPAYAIGSLAAFWLFERLASLYGS